MQFTIIGLPYSGKTTVFNALTGAREPVGQFGVYVPGEVKPNVAVVRVPDRRLDVLAAIFHPRKVTPADVTYADVAGIGLTRERGVSGELLTHLSRADALLHVVRAFMDPNVPHVEGSVDPLRDIAAVHLELVFSDLAIIERRLQRLQEMLPKLRPDEREPGQREQGVLARLKEGLEQEIPIRALDLTEEEERAIRHYQFLTAKPMLILLNVGEEQLGDRSLEAEVQARYKWPGTKVAELCGKIEMELGRLAPEDVPEFLAGLGIEEPARDRVIRLSYELLGVISFFTGGPVEVRAWTVRRGTTAVRAAGTVHSDMERGFIRAEVVAFDDLARVGSIAEARRQGLLHVEGRNYIVQDGDVINFLFSV